MSPKFYDPHTPTSTGRNRLPHWSQQGGTYFVTFRLADSIPATKLREHVAKRENFENEHGPRPWSHEVERDYYLRFFGKIERWLDAGGGHCALRDSENSRIVEDSLKFFDEQRYVLHAWVVMPNHVHVLFETLGDATPAKIIHSWKGHSARRVNERSGRSGALWQRSYFDRMIRDWAHFGRCVRYILRNPAKAGLSDKRCRTGSSRLGDSFRPGLAGG